MSTRHAPKPISPQALEAAALRYLGRFASSAANLKRVLMRKVDRSLAVHDGDRDTAAAWVDALVARYRSAGILNDGDYARMKAESLHRRGASRRLIQGALATKGLSRTDADAALAAIDDATDHDADLTAATALARRRRLGPYRPAEARAANRDRDLAALGRAGFDYETARTVIDAADPDDLQPGRR